ncbi:glycosyltransferase [Geobacter sp. DSM 9736]|uniref:glycosyltransferase n=1 Tax=Geobacter sp. DSM 9736 TaxID=1277350 RepID=UPI0015603A28|nr:glycosyltransferase [Geobacter sp. DSM 9736]
MLSNSPVSPMDIAAFASARAKDVPSIVYQHGIFLGNPDYLYAETQFPDYWLNYGPGETQFAEQHGCIGENVTAQPVMVGCIDYDRLVQRYALDNKEKSTDSCTILYPLATLHGDYRPLRNQNQADISYWRTIKETIQLCCSFPFVTLVVKTFPHEHVLNPVALWVKEQGITNCVVIDQPWFAELAPIADVIITDIVSSPMIQATATRKHLITYANPDHFPQAFPAEALRLLSKRASVAYTKDDFFQKIKETLVEKTWLSTPPNNNEFLMGHGTYLNDGRSSERAATFISELIHSPAIGTGETYSCEEWLTDTQRLSYSDYWNDENIEKSKEWWILDGNFEKMEEYLHSTGLPALLEEAVKAAKASFGKEITGIGCDLGAGNLWAEPFLFRHGQPDKVYCIEYSRHRLFKLGPAVLSHYGISPAKTSLVLGDFHQLHFSDASLDFLFLSQAFHHSDKPELLLSEMRRVLKPDGFILLIGEHYPPDESAIQPFPVDSVTGDHYYTLKQYSEMFSAAGFEGCNVRIRNSEFQAFVLVPARKLAQNATEKITILQPNEAACPLPGNPSRWAYLGTNARFALELEAGCLKDIPRIQTGLELQRSAERVRQPFIKWLDDLNSERGGSVAWWASQTSSKKPYSQLFPSLCFLDLAIRLRQMCQDEHLLLVVENVGLRRQLEKLWGGSSSAAPWDTAAGRMAIQAHAQAVHTQHYRHKVAELESAAALPPSASSPVEIAILTYVDDGVLDETGNLRDRYFGVLPQWLRAQGQDVAWIPFIYQWTMTPWEEAVRRVRSCPDPVIFMHDYLTPDDVARSITTAETDLVPCWDATSQSCAGLRVEELLKEEEVRAWSGTDVPSHLLFVPFLRRLKEKNPDITTFIYPFENQPWEKVFCLAVRQFFPRARLIGYQHTMVQNMWLPYFPEATEWTAGLLPDQVACAGEASRQIFKNNGFPEKMLKIGGALRYAGLLGNLEKKVTKISVGNRILATLPIGENDSAALLHQLVVAFANNAAVSVRLKPHPTLLPPERIHTLLPGSSSLPDNFEVVTGTADEALADADLLVYSNTTTAHDALGRGLPLIHVIPQTVISLDSWSSLIDLPGFRSVATPEELAAAANEVLNLSTTDRDKHARMAREAVARSFSKITDECLSTFLPDTPPTISVIIPCYNYGRYLGDAVSSVLNQTYQNFEIIIVNDGSPDDTKEVAEKLIADNPGHRITLLNQENSGQPAISRNNGIRVAKGEYILCLDADDIIAPTMLEEYLNLLKEHPEISIAYADYETFGATESNICHLQEYNLNDLLTTNHMIYCALYPRKVWEEVGGYKTNVRGYEDWDFWIACGEKGYYAKRIAKPLLSYRIHSGGLYNNALDRHQELMANIILNHPSLYDHKSCSWAGEFVKSKRDENTTSTAACAVNQKPLSPEDGICRNYPRNVHFLLNDKCNAKCVFCGGDYYRSKSGKAITLEKFKKMANNLHLENFATICLAGAGDPLLNPDFMPIVRYTNQNYPNVGITVTTNGIALTPELSAEIMSSGIFLVNVSINAATRATYHRLMQVDQFERVCANAAAFTAQREKSGARAALQLSCAISRINIEELPELVELANSLGVRHINLMYCRFYPKSLRHLNIESNEYLLKDEESLFFHQELSDRKVLEAKELAERYGISITHEPLFREKGTPRPCTWTTTELMVGFDGEVFPCGGGELHFKKKVRDGVYHFGNALEEPLETFWNNDFYRRLRISSKRADECSIEECRFCANLMQHDDVRSHIMEWKEFDAESTDRRPNTAPPLVSVIVPTYNRPHLLPEALRSILDQKYSNIEIIVVNDAGEDVERLVSSISPDIVYLRHDRNKGLAAARNTGIRHARGKYIAYLDDDDLFYPDHVGTLVEFLERNNSQVAYTDSQRSYQILRDGRYEVVKREPAYGKDFDYDEIMVDNFIPILCVIHEKSCIGVAGYFDESLCRHEDWDLLIRLSRNFRLDHIPKITCEFSYRIDGSGMTPGTFPLFQVTRSAIHAKYDSLLSPELRRRQRIATWHFMTAVHSFIEERVKPLLPLFLQGRDAEGEQQLAKLETTGATKTQLRSALAFLLGMEAIRKNDIEEAAQQWETAAAIDPMNPTAARHLAVLYEKLGRQAEAILVYERILSHDDIDINSLLSIADLYRKEGRTSEAIMSYRKVLELDPDNAGASAALDELPGRFSATGTMCNDSPDKPLVSIIIPLYNKVEYTKQCLQALSLNTDPHPPYELIIVDNASSDGTAEYLRTLSGDVTIVANVKNLGFAKACNQGGRLAQGRYVVFLNNDTIPHPGWLDALVRGVEQDGADIVGAKLLYPNGRVQHAGVAFNEQSIGYHIFNGFPANTPAVSRKRFMQCITGACMLMRRELFSELGGFDEGYVNGFEDVDLCLRAGQRGRRILYTPESILIHFEETSEGRKDHDQPNIRRFLSRWQGKVRCDDMDIYQREGFGCEKMPDGRIRLFPTQQVQPAIKQYSADQPIVSGNPSLGSPATQHEKQSALALKEKGQIQEALESLLNISKSGDTSVLADIGDCLAALGHNNEAAAAYAEACSVDPSNVQAYVGLGVIGILGESLSEAEDAFLTALKYESRSVKATCGLGLVRTAQGCREEAFDLFIKVLDIDPENLTSLHELVKLAYSLGRFDQVAQSLERYLLYHPGDTDMLFSLAGLYYKDGNREKAGEAIERILILCPDYEGAEEFRAKLHDHPIPPVHEVAGATADDKRKRSPKTRAEDPLKLKDAGRFEEALVAFTMARTEGDLSVLTDMGDCCANLSRFEDAAQLYKQALQVNRKDIRPLVGLGVTSLVQQKLTNAVTWFNKALRIDPDNVSALSGLGMVRNMQNKSAEAIEYFKRALNADAENLTSLHELIKAVYATEKYHEALPYLEHYLKYHPADLDLLYALAGLQFKAGRHLEAMNHIEKVLMLSPQYEGGQELWEKIREAA